MNHRAETQALTDRLNEMDGSLVLPTPEEIEAARLEVSKDMPPDA